MKLNVLVVNKNQKHRSGGFGLVASRQGLALLSAVVARHDVVLVLGPQCDDPRLWVSHDLEQVLKVLAPPQEVRQGALLLDVLFLDQIVLHFLLGLSSVARRLVLYIHHNELALTAIAESHEERAGHGIGRVQNAVRVLSR